MLNTFARKYWSWKNYHHTVSELSRLSDHELHDLGIGRVGIEYVARRSTH
ncbi:DUF1127 domain-containing protein [Breoghania sp.]|nr:DUF1127 domain-containing protein [Breoghania sp.]MDJ0929612.1 DUF1127 domain-containing protein [Breoghania sp.]